MKNKECFSEVIESSLNGWIAQSWQWHKYPAFGSLVSVDCGNRVAFGIVHQINTGSIDPIRQPVAYQKTYEELVREQPQIFEFLRTTFSCLSVGYLERETLYYLLAPEPPKIHSFVSLASTAEVKRFFSSERFLHVLFGASQEIFNLDELLLAILKNLSVQGVWGKPEIDLFVDTFSLISGNDYRRLRLFLQRAQFILDL
ncbi:MAG: HAS barrel-like protein [candidate division TM6 bacterium GW2011_GWF2_32_72]|nr:MAG: HAS barrel-like protein [candidate division TM6 bacterium GW2011_GWF2_32_72]